MSTETATERMCRDVHPAEILMPDQQVLTGLRIFITTHRAIGYQATPDRRIEQAFELRLATPGSVPASRAMLQGGQLELARRMRRRG